MDLFKLLNTYNETKSFTMFMKLDFVILKNNLSDSENTFILGYFKSNDNILSLFFENILHRRKTLRTPLTE